MFIAKSFEELMVDAEQAVLGTDGQLTDFSVGSDLYILTRGFMTLLARGYSDLQDALTDATIGTAAGTRLEAHTASFGVFRTQGTLATGSLIATPKSGAVSVLIPAGSRRFTAGDQIYVNTTDVTLAAPYTLVPVSATRIGAEYDLAPGNTLLEQAVDLNPFWTFTVGSGYNTLNQPTGFIRGGSDRESDDQLRSRFSDFINSLSRGTYRAVRTAILGVADVESVVLKEYTPAVGWFTAYIDDGTDVPGASLLANVAAALDESKAFGLGYRVLAMPKTFVPITAVVKIDPLFVASGPVIAEMCREAILALLKTYVFGESLYLSKLMEVCHSVPGVIQAIIYLPATDVLVLPEEAIRAGVVTVTAVV